jgi:AcrR family transcriptional regulator
VPGLRERKKLQTRQLIADTAARLFVERGFDAVTVDEIAEAAEVARKTVFNYFPTKEDLALDRVTERENELIGIVRDRPEGMSLVTAFRQQAVRLICDREDRPARLGRAELIQLVDSSAALQRAIHARRANLIRTLAAEVAAATGAPAHDPVAFTAACSLLGAYRSLAHEYDHRHMAGQARATIVLALHAEASRVFDLLDHGLAGYAPARRSLSTGGTTH